MRSASTPVLVAGAFVLAACRGGGPPPPSEPHADLTGQIVFVISGSGQRCTGDGAYRLEPISMTGSTGRRTATEKSVQWSGLPVQLIGGDPVSYGCVTRFSELGLAVGTWRVTASSGGWTAQCERRLG